MPSQSNQIFKTFLVTKNSACRIKIDMYKAETVLKVKNADGIYIDPLNLWKKRSEIFPK